VGEVFDNDMLHEETYSQSKLEDVHVGDGGGLTLNNGSSEGGREEQSSGSSNELHDYDRVNDIRMLVKKDVSVVRSCELAPCVME